MWRIERLAWWAIAGILFAAAAGLFGHGLASRGALQISDPAQPDGSLTLDFDRFGRAHAESQFVLSRRPGGPEGGTWFLWLSGEFLAGVAILEITPEPTSQHPVADGVCYGFRIENGPQRVIFRFKPDGGGPLLGSLRVNDGPPAAFRQWLFP
jgi:hypothetical protein